MVRFCCTAFVALCGSCIALPVVAQQDQPAARGAELPGFDEVDATGNGMVSYEEFADALPDIDDPDQVFIAADVDGDGQINRQEWVNWREQRVGAAEMPPAEVEEIELRRQIELELTGDSIEGRFLTDADVIGLGGNQLGVGLLLSEDRDTVASGQILAPGLLQGFVPDFVTLSLGAKAFIALLAEPDDDVAAIAPGAKARVGLPFLENVPIAGVGEIFFAPDILSFGESEEVIDFSGRLEVQFLERTTGFVGFRVLNFERKGGGEDTIVDSLMGGVRFTF